MNEKIKECNEVFFNSKGEVERIKGVCVAKNFKASFQALREGLMDGD